MKFLDSALYESLPWKNGGGTTRIVASHTDSSICPDFLWRVSLAAIDRLGVFSHFEGVDRSLVVLKGDGVVLKSGDVFTELTPLSGPFSFEGERLIECDILGGVTTDLNAMTRRGLLNHTIHRTRIDAPTIFSSDSDHTLIIFNAPMTVRTEFGQYGTHQFDALGDISNGETIELVPKDEAEFVVIRFQK